MEWNGMRCLALALALARGTYVRHRRSCVGLGWAGGVWLCSALSGNAHFAWIDE